LVTKNLEKESSNEEVIPSYTNSKAVGNTNTNCSVGRDNSLVLFFSRDVVKRSLDSGEYCHYRNSSSYCSGDDFHHSHKMRVQEELLTIIAHTIPYTKTPRLKKTKNNLGVIFFQYPGLTSEA
jgi:hypothetical protein